MLLSPTNAAHRLRWMQYALLMCAGAALPALWRSVTWLLLTAGVLYGQAVLRTRRLILTPQGLQWSGGLFLQEELQIPSHAELGLRVIPLPGAQEIFLLLPHRAVYLFPMTKAQLHQLQSHLEQANEV